MFKELSGKILFQQGYQPVELPKENIDPGLVFSIKKKQYNRLGPLQDFLEESANSLPTPQSSVVAFFSGVHTQKAGIDISIGIIGDLLKAMGIPVSADLSLFGGEIKQLAFSFGDVKSANIEVTSICKFLEHAKVTQNLDLRHKIDEPNEAVILTEVLKSSSFGITGYNKSGIQINFDANALKDLLKASIDAGFVSIRADSIKFQGTASLTFALKALEFKYQPVVDEFETGNVLPQIDRTTEVGLVKIA